MSDDLFLGETKKQNRSEFCHELLQKSIFFEELF